MSELLKQINDDVKNIFEKNLEATKAYVVPSRDDQGLTFTLGDDKKGKLIETCVLFVDMRNSTQISNAMRTNKSQLGKIYSAFVHSMTSIADEYGSVRNIVGDRVMVVFDPSTCFTDAVHCAAMMNTVASRILRKHSGLPSFKVGIGIDYGEMLVLKTGIPKKFNEQSEYKGLVWVGNAANIASKLTDIAGKELQHQSVQINYFSLERNRPFSFIEEPPQTIFDLLLTPDTSRTLKNTSLRRVLKSASLTIEEFAKEVTIIEGKINYKGSEVSSVQQLSSTDSIPSVLMTTKVYGEYRKANPKSKYLPQLNSKSYRNSPVGGVYGGNLFDVEVNKILPLIGRI